MLIVGNKNIPYQEIQTIQYIEDIKNSDASKIVYFSYDIDIIKYCNKNNVRCAVYVSNLVDAIFCNALDVYFIITNKDIAKTIQNAADNYMFDSKILQIIQNDNDIEDVASNQIDGCIYKEIL